MTQNASHFCNQDDVQEPSNLSYIHNPGAGPLRYITIKDLVDKAANKYGDIDAIVSVYQKQRITYRELLLQSKKFAAGLIDLGLQKGDKIGLWAPNIAEWIIAFSAAARIGLVTVMINPKYQAPELKHALNISEAKALICLHKYKSIDFYAILLNLIPEIQSSNSGNILSRNVPMLKMVITISDIKLKGTYNYREILNSTNNNLINIQPGVTPDDLASIQFSSGTTGSPKSLALTHFQMVNNAWNVGERLGLADNRHVLCVQVQLFHAIGIVICVLSALCNGTTLVLPSPLYNSTANLNALEEERCTMVCGTPTMYIDLINVQKKLCKKLTVTRALLAGAPWSSKLINDIKETLKINEIKYAYGATEMTTVAFQSRLDREDSAIENTGYIGDYVEAKVIDTSGNIVPFGTPGELCVRGYLTMSGYLREPAETKKVLDENGWYKTGDQFVLYKDGSGRVVGRLKDMIIRGGANISPTEIEEFLYTHPDIVEVSVIGIPNDRLGEEVGACIRLKEGTELRLDTLKEFCLGKIANYKIPSRIKIMQDFPKTTSGKIQKFALKQSFNLLSE